MKVKLNANETYYRQIISSMGIAMLALIFLMDVAGLLQIPFQKALDVSVPDPIAVEVASQLFYAGCYLLVFMLPAAVLKLSIQKRGLSYHPMKAELRLSRYLPVILLGGILLIWTQSYINGALVSIFNYSAFSSEVLWQQGGEMYGYRIVLQFLVAALVPAFCEEFLFRGAVLTNLLPFGRVPAILISSLLFSVMHRNAEQILYAFAAGVLLGLVYERTGSIWNCFFLHLTNNFASVIMEALAWRLNFENELVWAFLETAMCMACIGCVVLLTVVLSPPKSDVNEGFFGRSLPASDGYATHPISSSRAVRLFLSPPIILFLALSAAQMIALIGMAWVYGYGV